MNAVKYLKEVYRMCESMEGCINCPLDGCGHVFPCKGTKLSAEYKDPEKCISIVGKWSDEHPIETRQSKLIKMFPNATLDALGSLDICPMEVDKDIICLIKTGAKCLDCRKNYWLAEVE